MYAAILVCGGGFFSSWVIAVLLVFLHIKKLIFGHLFSST